jgi:hypothetical protein
MVVPDAPAALAADLGVSPAKKVRHSHKRPRVVRDYDGTPVAVYRVRRPPMQDPYGWGMPVGEYVHVPLIRPQPRIYFNGQPVMSRLTIRNYY